MEKIFKTHMFDFNSKQKVNQFHKRKTDNISYSNSYSLLEIIVQIDLVSQ